MARFGFSIPGRKKAPPPPITVTEPMTKAHKILGSVPLNIDSGSTWDLTSVPEAQVTGSSGTRSYAGSASRQPTVGTSTPASSAEPWGEESDILPPSFKLNGHDGMDDDFTETSTVLKSKQSSSTLKSWYDKSKMPLAVSQQTSASAMAKGLPSKAQRMLDMDNIYAQPKAKKPAKLDLSNFLPGNRSPKPHHHEPLLGPDFLTASPSLLSPALSSNSSHRRRILRRRPTKESLAEYADGGRPQTSGSSNTQQGKDGHMKGLADLYEHYEQMSFRQVLDDDLDHEDEGLDGLGIMSSPSQTDSNSHTTHADPQLEKLLRQAHIAALAASKSDDHSIPPEDGESVSSRHTRTSRASIIARSMQSSDLQETSVLMLSSDSESDYDEPETRSQTSTSTRPLSRIPETMALLEQGFAPSLRSMGSSDKRASKSSKRTSFAPSVTYLGVPNTQSNNAASHDSQITITGLNASNSSKRGSILSSSSATSSAPTWQSRSDCGSSDAYVVAIMPTKGTISPMKGHISEDSDVDIYDSQRSGMRESMAAHTDQPTPPLSPSSVDFYIRSAHSSMDGPASHNRFMAVTRQEEMLLSALRHKRQTMRESKHGDLSSEDESSPPRQHRSKASDATVTNLLDFDFPAPPSSNDSTPQLGHSPFKTKRSNQTLRSKLSTARLDEDGSDDDSDVPMAPAPLQLRQSQTILQNTRYQPPEVERKQRVDTRYNEFQDDINPDDLDELLSGIGKSSSRASLQRPSGSSRASTTSSSSSKSSRRVPRLAMTSNMDPVMESDDDMDAAGIPRPDSPISPSSFPMPPTMTPLNKKLARLSAVGGVRIGDTADWFTIDEPYTQTS